MSRDIVQSAVRNRLLRNLPERAFSLLAPHLEPVDLPLGLILEVPDQPIEQIIYLESGIAARMIVGHNNDMAESGHIGSEGMTGKPIVQGGSHATNQIHMQFAGKGLRIAAAHFVEAMATDKDLAVLMRKYVLACEVQVEHSLLAATTRMINERLARWLLMYHDRVEGDELQITHDLLASMLHVRRAGITSATHVLEGLHAIRATRGSIKIVDREALESIAGGSYGIPEAVYERLIPNGAEDETRLYRESEGVVPDRQPVPLVSEAGPT